GPRTDWPSFGDDHPSGTNDAVTDAVAALNHLEHRAGLGIRARLRQERLVHVRVERPVRLDLDEPLLRERAAKGLLDESYAVQELRLLVLLAGLERALEAVEDRQQLAHEPLVRVGDEPLLVADSPLAVVLEVRLDALSKPEVLVALGDDLRDVVGSRSFTLRLLDVRLGELLAHDFVASSSSMTSKSASSTTSSSVADPPLPDVCAPAWAACCACA